MSELFIQAGSDFMMLVEFMALGILALLAAIWLFGS